MPVSGSKDTTNNCQIQKGKQARKPRGNPHAKVMTTEQERQIERLIIAGKDTFAAIGRAFGFSKQRIQQLAKKLREGGDIQ